MDGVRLHYIERGAGPPIVLLHGNMVLAEDFAISGVLDLLARAHRVIAFDRPGFGYSERPRETMWTAEAQATLLREALRRIGVRNPVLVGHSWGALVALAMALEDQRDTAALALLSGYYVPTPRGDVPLAMLPAVPVLGDVLRYTVWPLLGWLTGPWVFRKTFAPSPVTEPFRDRFPLGMVVRPWQLRATAADAALMIPSAAALFNRHRELTVPVVIMAGSGDRIVDTAGQSGRLHASVAQSDFRVVEGAGHMIHHIAPERVAEAIQAAATPGRAVLSPDQGSRSLVTIGTFGERSAR